MTQIIDNTYIRSSYSQLARQAEKMKFKAGTVIFAERAPESNGFALKNEGWESKGSITLAECQNIKAHEIWYKTSTFGGAHKVYVR